MSSAGSWRRSEPPEVGKEADDPFFAGTGCCHKLQVPSEVPVKKIQDGCLSSTICTREDRQFLMEFDLHRSKLTPVMNLYGLEHVLPWSLEVSVPAYNDIRRLASTKLWGC